MSAVGAKLQNCNEQLVYLIEELKQKLDKLDHEIDSEIKVKEQLAARLQEVSDSLECVNRSLSDKLALKEEYSDTLNEAENAYLKILESSETLISVVKMKSLKLDDKNPLNDSVN